MDGAEDLQKLLSSLDLESLDLLHLLSEKETFITEINRNLCKKIDAKFNGSIPISKIVEKINCGELQKDSTATEFICIPAGSDEPKNYTPIR